MYESEINAKQAHIGELERNYERLRVTSEWHKDEMDREIASLRDKHKSDMNSMIMEVQALQHQVEGKF